MTHTYQVTGMTCTGCKAAVEQALLALPQVTAVTINLNEGVATLEMTTPISEKSLQNTLPEKYTLTANAEKKENHTIFKTQKEKPISKLKQLQPLFLILGCIVLITTAVHFRQWNIEAAMLDFMGLFFMVFSLFKFFDLNGFAKAFNMYDPLAKAFPTYAKVYPFLEVLLGLFFLARFQIEILLVVTIVLLGITTLGLTRTLLQKKTIQCACLGTVLKLPMTQATFIENAIMIVMAIILLIH